MQKMDTYYLHQSLLAAATTIAAKTPPPTTYNTGYTLAASVPKSVHPNTITSVSSVIFRIIFISLIGIVSIWANHEASKGFSVTIVNDADKYSLAGKRFSLFYESNNKATRIVLNTSNFVENLLYPNDQDLLQTKKQINGVTLRFAPTSFPSIVSVDSRKPDDYIINLSPSLLEGSNKNELIVLAVLRGMARVWLWDGNGAAPPGILNGIVEYITSLAGFTIPEVWNSGGGTTVLPEKNEICWKDEDRRKVAGFLRYYGGGEMIRRLNEGMKNGWHDSMVDDALGMTGQHACASYDMIMSDHYASSSM